MKKSKASPALSLLLDFRERKEESKSYTLEMYELALKLH